MQTKMDELTLSPQQATLSLRSQICSQSWATAAEVLAQALRIYATLQFALGNACFGERTQVDDQPGNYRTTS